MLRIKEKQNMDDLILVIDKDDAGDKIKEEDYLRMYDLMFYIFRYSKICGIKYNGINYKIIKNGIKETVKDKEDFKYLNPMIIFENNIKFSLSMLLDSYIDYELELIYNET